MRWLFLLLLIANIAYVGWELSREAAVNPDITTTVSDIPRIVLLRERERDQAQPVEGSSGEGREPVVVDVSEPSEIATTTVMEAGLDEPADIVNEPSAEAPLEPYAGQQPDMRNETPTDQLAGEDSCYTLGPFRELDELSAITQAIKNYVVDTSFRSRDEMEQSMFSVLLESTGSMKKARALSKELVSKNVKDYFIISSGANKYGISLGHFREKARAYRHAQHVRDLGFDPVVEPVFRSHTIYWLDYRMEAGKEIPPKVFEDRLPESVNRLDRPCQS